MIGTWGGGKKKPFTYSAEHMKQLGLYSAHSEADRKVPLQPLKFGKGKIRMHSSRMRTARSSSRLLPGGVCLSACWDTSPRAWRPPGQTPQHPPWVWAWRLPHQTRQQPPWVWAWRAPL